MDAGIPTTGATGRLIKTSIDMVNSVTVGICRCRASAIVPTYATPGALALDFYAAETVAIAGRGDARISTGIIVALPMEYGLWLLPRSSFFRRHGLLLTNSVGLVDADYCGPKDEIAFSYYNTRDVEAVVTVGERIGQGLLVPRVRIAFADHNPHGSRSRGGFGSTGA